jgi:predicted Na+-dependent transporter
VCLILMILVPFPLGFFVRNRLVAFVAYIAIHSFVFTFQCLSLVVDWVGGSQEAFGAFPKAGDSNVLAYGIINLVIYAVGFGLILLGHRVGRGRRSRRTGPVELAPAVS